VAVIPHNWETGIRAYQAFDFAATLRQPAPILSVPEYLAATSILK
jgi:hypothetical protein